MRLKSIKLAGFKSFVDPTSIPFPSNMTAIVGPNGCGKSNTIDAVRWVMGESSAKHLRGESMTDVIFNGSNHRKPVGQCSVELIFDNTSGKAPGEFAAYNEISVKRRVTRDGQSHYFLNGTKCRRKDITDLFLGTGMGPRSYAIIEQGMISKLIEAKPEELRVFIEEAAGISKYKERRKETESRMRRTRENLERLTDIRDELERQLQTLHRQAQAAEKYTEFKKEERIKKAQLAALRWQRLDNEAKGMELKIAEFETLYEKHIAEQRHIDAQVEELRDQNSETTEAFNKVQARFYEIGSEIARFEQSMQFEKEKAAQMQTELLELDRNNAEVQKEMDNDQARLEEIEEQLAIMGPDLEMAAEADEMAQGQLLAKEEAQQSWQQKWESFNADAAGPKRVAEVAQSRIQHLEQVLERANRRLQELYAERDTIADDPESELIEELLIRTDELEMTLEEKQGSLDDLNEQYEQAKQELETKRHQLQESKRLATEKRGRKATLEALQQAAMGEAAGGVQRWLESHQLQHNERLAAHIHVTGGWNKAVETVMGRYLQAVCVDDLARTVPSISRFESGLLDLVVKGSPVNNHANYLISKVDTDFDLSHWLASVRCVETLDQALAIRESLADSESVITKDGIWLGKNWLRVNRDENGEAGILSRQQELEDLELELDELEAQEEEIEVDTEVVAMRVQSLEEQQRSAQQEWNQSSREYAEVKSQLSGKQVQVDQLNQRRERVNSEISEQEMHRDGERESLAQAREELQEALDAMEEGVDEREALVGEKDSLRMAVDDARDAARQAKDQAHNLQLKEQTLKSQLNSLNQAIDRLQQQKDRFTEKREMLLESQLEAANPSDEMQMELEQKLEARLAVEEELSVARKAMEGYDSKMRELDRDRHGSEQKAMDVRTQLESVRMEAQAVITRRTTLKEQLVEDSFDLETVVENLPEDASEQEWEEELQSLANRIARLGAINLAAIDEYKIQSERKEYLDAQNEDLEKAIVTLENAIIKIDKETRSRFKETFDKINAGVQELFPKVFGGGHAYLELTGEDMLDTGVAIMARPPGKKNSTIHLLSGGEKALTAIALVFSIFKLNPAPFCMLDEVDAPLDDANVGRYARLVDAMSEHVQFIYITHNKIAMEMAKDLMGVTMNEPGVSRLVSVNVEEAAELAAV